MFDVENFEFLSMCHC